MLMDFMNPLLLYTEKMLMAMQKNIKQYVNYQMAILSILLLMENISIFQRELQATILEY